MPEYLFQDPKTGKTKSVIQSVNDEHVYSENGLKWNRVFTIPQAAFDTKVDAMSHESFLKKTSKNRGTLGDLFDLSREMSLKREEKIGKDPIKEKTAKEYSKQCRGKKHPLLNKNK